MYKPAAVALAFILLAALLAGCMQADNPTVPMSAVSNVVVDDFYAGAPPAKSTAAEYAAPFFTPRPYPFSSPSPTLTPLTSLSPSPTLTPSPSPATDLIEPSSDVSHQGARLSENAFYELAPTTRMSFEELVGDNGNYEAVQGYPSPGTFRLIVDLYHQVVIAYKKDKNGAYTVPVRYMVCSSGSSKNPSPRGVYEADKHRVRFGLFVNDGVYGQYWSQITRRIYFHSLLYSRKDANTYTTTSYKNLGDRASHGCIRLLVPDARWIYYHIAPGTQVELRKGEKDDVQTAAIKEKLTRPALPKQRPKLKRGEVPYTDNWDINTYLSNYENVVMI